MFEYILIIMKLVIVESPGKTKKIEEFLGSDYKVMASFGHIMDLDPKSLSIEVENNFKPLYSITDDKKKVVANLISMKNKCSEVIIASDKDREGEMIGYSIMDVLKLVNPKRIVFNQITQKAIVDAINDPQKIDMNMVEAQQARRLLDRLMGYMISPLLQKYLQGKLSAGRVQSVVLRIIVDMENTVKEYNDSDAKSYFKSTCIFIYKKECISTVLYKNNNVYKIDNIDTAKSIISKKDTISRVVNVTTKETTKSPPLPHITSSLMQEASTKLGMNSKRTMDVAQKLYEGGYITYMRTDSTNLSSEAIADIKKYVIDTYGDKYYNMNSKELNSKEKNSTENKEIITKKTKKKDDHSQEAHEAIRPTHIEDIVLPDTATDDMKRLYKVIWNRAVASLMSNAIIDVMNVDINIYIAKKNTKDNNISILPEGTIYRAIYENIKFDGYLILYNNREIENDSDENVKTGLIDIKENTILTIDEMIMTETYTSPPLRYNEAGLIKYLKNEGIGRPSTYSSIISKVIEREYIVISNVEGIEKDSIILSNKHKEKTKKIKVGAEKQKLIPTELGLSVNNFMMTHFEAIMGIKFTADMEDKLDLIAQGKAKWYNILKEYYNIFNPIVVLLNKNAPNLKLGSAYTANDINLGSHNGTDIFISKNKFGWCVKMKEDDKWKYGAIGDTPYKDISLEDAVNFLSYPKELGLIGNNKVSICKGKFGLYFKIGSIMVNSGQKAEEELTLEYAKELYEASCEKESNTYMIGKTKVFVKTGEHGPYIMIPHGTKKPTFVSIPKNIDHTTITATKIKELIDNNKKKDYTKKNIK